MKATLSALKVLGLNLAGWGLLAAGVVLMPLPGPGTLVLFAGLVVLSTRYAWARRLRKKASSGVEEATKQSVATKKRVAFAGFTAILAGTFSVFLMLDPVLPDWIDFTLLGIDVGPRIPGASLATGLFGLMGATAALGVLIYARWRYSPDGVVVPDVEADLGEAGLTE